MKARFTAAVMGKTRLNVVFTHHCSVLFLSDENEIHIKSDTVTDYTTYTTLYAVIVLFRSSNM